MLEVIGWMGALAFAICAAPQAYQCYKQGHAQGVSKGFMWLWLYGEICMIYYTPMKMGWNWPIMTNYLLNLFFVSIIMRYIFFPRKEIK